MATEGARVVIDGYSHDVLPLVALESLAHTAELTVEYPPPGGDGWAVSVLGSQRWAAWYVAGAA